jgi:hypothetical protein
MLSAFTFFFWIPAAIQISYLYLGNAYFIDVFVSRQKSDSSHRRLDEIRESMSAELIRWIRGTNIHDIRETVDRYVGLADAARTATRQKTARHELFEAAGREEYYLGQLCLMRRNRRRLERHHIQAREDFLALFRQASLPITAADAIRMGIDLARRLDDSETVERLSRLASRSEISNADERKPGRVITSTSVSPLALTASLHNE